MHSAPMASAQQQQPTAALTAPGASAWKTPEKICGKLATEIAGRVTGLNAKQMQAFIKNKDNFRLLLMYYLACTEISRQDEYRTFNEALKKNVQGKKDEITRIENELKTKKDAERKNAEYRLKCAKADLKKLQQEAEYPINLEKHAKVLQAILADAEWMEDIAFSGEMHRFARVVQIIDAIAQADSGALKKVWQETQPPPWPWNKPAIIAGRWMPLTAPDTF